MFLRRWRLRPLALSRSYLQAPQFAPLKSEQIWEAVNSDLSPNDVCIALLHLTEKGLPIRGDQRLVPVLERVKSGASELSARSIANVFVACQRMDVSDHAFWNCLEAQARNVLSDFTAQQLVCIFIALSSHKCQDGKFISLLTQEAMRKASQFSPQQICMLLTTLFAGFRLHTVKPLVARMCVHASSVAKDFAPVEIAGVLNALRNLKFTDTLLMTRLCEVALERAAEFKSQEIVNTLSALAHFNFFKPALVTRLIVACKPMIPHFTSLGISLLLDALAKFEVFDVGLVKALCEVAVLQIPTASAMSIANTLNALAKFDYFHYDLISESVKYIPLSVAGLTASPLTKLMFALGKFRFYHQAAVASIITEVKSKMRLFCASQLSVIVDVVAKFAIFDRQLFKMMCDHAMTICWQFTPNEALCFLHGLFTLGYYDWGLYNRVRERLSLLQDLNQNEMTQLFLCNLCLSIERPRWPQLAPSMDHFQPQPPAHAMHRHVAWGLRLLKLKPWAKPDKRVFGGLSVDFALLKKKCVIQADGPLRFCFQSRRALGRTLLKRRLLSKMGWKVVSVPYYRWLTIRRYKRAKFLKSLINT